MLTFVWREGLFVGEARSVASAAVYKLHSKYTRKYMASLFRPITLQWSLADDQFRRIDEALAEHDQSAEKTDMEKMTETLASFSPEDRASAMKQHFCPVSDQMLGSMGAPEKVDVNGQSVWICCDGCKDKLLADPDKYLAKIAK